MEVSSRRLAIVQHRHPPPARGLLSLISLLRAFPLTGINQPKKKERKRNQSRRLGRRADVPQKNWRSPGASGGPKAARSDFEAPIRLAGQEGAAVRIASAVTIVKI